MSKSPNAFKISRPATRGFTLVELLVVVAIIGILIAVLLPSISHIRVKAKYAEASAQFLSLASALESYRGEQALGNSFPPSSSDNPTGGPMDRKKIADPSGNSTTANVAVDGAHLLVHALMGFDQLGPPGFKDVDRNGQWSNDTHGKYDPNPEKSGLYATHEGLAVHTRYGGTGHAFVDDKMRSRVQSLSEMEVQGRIASFFDLDRQALGGGIKLPVFLDPWDRPVLYFRANPAAQRMVGGSSDPSGTPGIYRADDNSIIAGYGNARGIDFGAGQDPKTKRWHNISEDKLPKHDDDLTKPQFEATLAAFIRDPAIKINTPVRRDSYLLISAGPDARYGTDDDAVNWQREGK